MNEGLSQETAKKLEESEAFLADLKAKLKEHSQSRHSHEMEELDALVDASTEMKEILHEQSLLALKAAGIEYVASTEPHLKKPKKIHIFA